MLHGKEKSRNKDFEVTPGNQTGHFPYRRLRTQTNGAQTSVDWGRSVEDEILAYAHARKSQKLLSLQRIFFLKIMLQSSFLAIPMLIGQKPIQTIETDGKCNSLAITKGSN